MTSTPPPQADPSDARVTVAVRIRPLRTDLAAEKYDTSCLYSTAPEAAAGCADAPTTVTIIHPSTKEQTDFAFDRVFDENDTQATVYSELVEDAVMSAIEQRGDLMVVAYGQTGSGKTFTMLGERSVAPPSTAPLISPGTSPSHQGVLSWLSPDSGVFLRAMNTLLAYRDMHLDTAHVLIYITAIELYNDTFIDLLGKGGANTAANLAGLSTSSNSFLSKSRAVMLGASGGSFVLPGQAASSAAGIVEAREIGETLVLSNAQRVLVDSLDAVQRCFDISHKNRSVSATNMNDVSSRSHALFQLDVVVQSKRQGNAARQPDLDAILDYQHLCLMQSVGNHRGDSSASFSRGDSVSSPLAGSSSTIAPLRLQVSQAALRNPSNDFDTFPIETCRITLVDLAGSERVKRSGVHGKEMQEAVFVNSSLSTLGLVVNSLCTRQQNASKHIPFRDSKMTRLLRPSFLSHHAKIIFITNLSPTSSSFVETLNSMRFAARLKELKYSLQPSGSSSGPSLGMLLSDERLQRLRLQLDEMCADVRVYNATALGISTDTDPLTQRVPTRMRRTLVQRPGIAAETLHREHLCRVSCVKEGMQRAREEFARAQSAIEAEKRAIEEVVKSETLAAAKENRGENEEDAYMTKVHLEASLRQTENTLLATRAACAAALEDMQRSASALAAEAAEVTLTLESLTAKRRGLLHSKLRQNTVLEELEEEQSLAERNSAVAASQLAADRSLCVLVSDDSLVSDAAEASDAVLQFQKALLERVALEHDIQAYRASAQRMLGGRVELDPDVMQRLVQHELDPSFTGRLSAAPLSTVYDEASVRTSQGRNRILNERLELAASVYNLSPLAFYFSPDLSPTRFVPWSVATRSNDTWSDDELDGDDAEQAASSLQASALKSHGKQISQATAFYLKQLALFGHLMRVLHRAERRRTRHPSSPLFLTSEVRAILVILDSVEVEERVVEGVVQRALQQLRPTSSASQSDLSQLPSAAGSQREQPTVPSPDGALASRCRAGIEALPVLVTQQTHSILGDIARAVTSARDSNAPLPAGSGGVASAFFLPCLLRCLQALSLLSVCEAFFCTVGLFRDHNAHQQVADDVAAELVRMQCEIESLSEFEQALLAGCQWACRACTDSPCDQWSLDDVTRMRARSKRAASQSTETTVAFLWSWKHRDVSLLRGMSTKCMLCSGLLRTDDGAQWDGFDAITEHVPTPARLVECLHLVLRVVS